jgi:hypothetical protein
MQNWNTLKYIDNFYFKNTFLDVSLSELYGEVGAGGAKKDREPIMLAFKSKNLYLICLLAFCFVCKYYLIILVYPFSMMNLVRPYAELNFKDPEYIRILMIIYPIVNGMSRLVWGSLVDYIPFKKLYGFLTIVGVLFNIIKYR